MTTANVLPHELLLLYADDIIQHLVYLGDSMTSTVAPYYLRFRSYWWLHSYFVIKNVDENYTKLFKLNVTILE